jgi:CheY-like chemotaxis protein
MLKQVADAGMTGAFLAVKRARLKLLIISDDPALLFYFSDTAAWLGVARCDVAASDGEAMEFIAKNGGYDLCFLDYDLATVDAVDMAVDIKAVSPEDCRLVMISGAEWSTIGNRSKASGVNRFLQKPILPSVILDCVNQCAGAEDYKKNEEKEAAGSNDFSGYCLLLAEDIEINREIVLALLESTGLAIDCAENGVQAVEMYNKEPERYDMIFMDVQMPEMDGYEATRHIRQSGLPGAAAIPIVAMTANVFREDIEKSLEAGMDAHVGKPLDFHEVLATLKRWLPAKTTTRRA